MRHVGLLLGLVSLLSAQTKDEAPLVLRSTTRLVQISVVVHDKKGQPVGDLTKDDFIITEKGKPQAISYFTVESSRKLNSTPPDKLGAGWYTNQLSQRDNAPNAVTVVLIDALNTKLLDQVYAREQIVKFLSQIQPQDRVAIYLMGTSLRILHDFTNDSSSLVAKMKRFRGEVNPENNLGPDPSLDPTGDPDLDAFLQQGFQMESDFRTVNRVLTTCAGLEAIAHHLERVPGRKNLLWLSGSFPLQIGMDDTDPTANPTRERRTFAEEMERAVRAINQANLAIYPVDARGLMVPQGISAEISGRGSARNPGTPRPQSLVDNHETLNYLADRTGGRAFYNNNDLTRALRLALHDSEVTYVLGYYPPDSSLDGRFHDIKIKVDRSGLDVRYRRGYFALREPNPTPEAEKAMIRDALWSPLDATGIGMTAGVVPNKQKPDELKIVIQLDPRNLRLAEKDGRYAGKLTLVFMEMSEEAKQVGGREQAISLNLTKEKYDAALKQGLTFMMEMPRLAGASYMRIAALNPSSGDLGTLRVPIPR